MELFGNSSLYSCFEITWRHHSKYHWVLRSSSSNQRCNLQHWKNNHYLTSLALVASEDEIWPLHKNLWNCDSSSNSFGGGVRLAEWAAEARVRGRGRPRQHRRHRWSNTNQASHNSLTFGEQLTTQLTHTASLYPLRSQCRPISHWSGKHILFKNISKRFWIILNWIKKENELEISIDFIERFVW